MLGAITAVVGLVRFAVDPPDGALVAAIGLATTLLAGEWAFRRWRAPDRTAIDPTGLLRSDAFEQALGEHIDLASHHLRPTSLVLIELHEAGWRPPSAFAAEVALLRSRVLTPDPAIARLGESRLALILDDTDETAAKKAIERLRNAIATSHGDDHRLVAGMASYPRHALDADRLLDRATHALDEARTIGRSVTLAPVDAPD